MSEFAYESSSAVALQCVNCGKTKFQDMVVIYKYAVGKDYQCRFMCKSCCKETGIEYKKSSPEIKREVRASVVLCGDVVKSKGMATEQKLQRYKNENSMVSKVKKLGAFNYLRS